MNDPSDTTSGDTGTTWVYTYDRGGNILNKKRYAYTTGTVGDVLQTIEYTYGDTNWKDKMTAYNGTAITYDAIGNPVTYGNWTYTWEKGRQLKKMEHTNGTIVEYAYNSEGLRVSKTVTNTAGTVTTTQYTLHGSNLVHLVKGSKYMHFWYDAQNRPTIVNYNGTRYAYIVNLQGDVLGLVDSNGDEVVRYTYDAWGKALSTTGTMASSVGALNPFRYRGYVYDTETTLYYLQARYYNPIWQRFLNVDNIFQGSLFTYCKNSPVVFHDYDGNDASQPWKYIAWVTNENPPILVGLKNELAPLCGFRVPQGTGVYVFDTRDTNESWVPVVLIARNVSTGKWQHINGLINKNYLTEDIMLALYRNRRYFDSTSKDKERVESYFYLWFKHNRVETPPVVSNEPYFTTLVKDFQKRNQLHVDGKAGKETLIELTNWLVMNCSPFRGDYLPSPDDSI